MEKLFCFFFRLPPTSVKETYEQTRKKQTEKQTFFFLATVHTLGKQGKRVKQREEKYHMKRRRLCLHSHTFGSGR